MKRSDFKLYVMGQMYYTGDLVYVEGSREMSLTFWRKLPYAQWEFIPSEMVADDAAVVVSTVCPCGIARVDCEYHRLDNGVAKG